MNSSKRGPAYGFKLSSLDTLCDTKSADKKLSVLHYIQETVRVKFSDLNSFDTELRFVDKAALGKKNFINDFCYFFFVILSIIVPSSHSLISFK